MAEADQQRSRVKLAIDVRGESCNACGILRLSIGRPSHSTRDSPTVCGLVVLPLSEPPASPFRVSGRAPDYSSTKPQAPCHTRG